MFSMLRKHDSSRRWTYYQSISTSVCKSSKPRVTIMRKAKKHIRVTPNTTTSGKSLQSVGGLAQPCNSSSEDLTGMRSGPDFHSIVDWLSYNVVEVGRAGKHQSRNRGGVSTRVSGTQRRANHCGPVLTELGTCRHPGRKPDCGVLPFCLFYCQPILIWWIILVVSLVCMPSSQPHVG